MIASNYNPFRVRQQDSDTKIKEQKNNKTNNKWWLKINSHLKKNTPLLLFHFH